MRAQQTRPKKAEANKRAKVKIQEERKASTNLLALQEHIPTTWEHGPKNRSENRSSAVQSKPDQKKAEAKKKRKSENPRRAQSFNEPSCFARTNSHDVGTRTKKLVRKPQLCGAEQNKTERKQQLAKLASKEAERTHLRRDGSREKKSKQTLKKILCYYT